MKLKKNLFLQIISNKTNNITMTKYKEKIN